MADSTGYDPRMLQLAQYGLQMASPQYPQQYLQQRYPFQQQRGQQQQQPLQVPGMQPMPSAAGAQSSQDDPSKPKQPPSMYEMMMNLGRMSRPQYDKAIQSSPPGQQQGAAMVSPWAWLGTMGMPGGAGWGGGGTSR